MLSINNKCIYSFHKAYNQWFYWDRDPVTRKEMKNLMKQKEDAKLSILLSTRMDLGNGGFQNIMGAGYCQMNELVVIQTMQGLLRYLKAQRGYVPERGIVIGFDGRYKSSRFANLAAAVFLSDNVKTYMFSKPCPSHFVPLTIIQYFAMCGVMITASEGTPMENGIRVYCKKGIPIGYPENLHIGEAILQELEPRHTSWDVSICQKSLLLEDPLILIQDVHAYSIKVHPFLKPKKTIVYTPLHGVGWKYIRHAFNHVGYHPLIPVTSQARLDSEFQTVEYPDPGAPYAFSQAIKFATQEGATIILANDNDAGRLGVAEFNDGEWKIFTGNEIGALLGWWMITCFKDTNCRHPARRGHLFSTVLSSSILSIMAQKHGMTFNTTFPGDYWMAHEAANAIENGKTPVFGFDESREYFFKSKFFAKDGIKAAVKMAEFIAYLEQRGENLTGRLNEIYHTYGQHKSINSYYTCDSYYKAIAIFHQLRIFYERNDVSDLPSLKNGKYKIQSVRIIRPLAPIFLNDEQPALLRSETCRIIRFSFNYEIEVTICHIGYSKKLKYLAEVISPPETQGRNEFYSSCLQELIEAFIVEVIKRAEDEVGKW